MAFSFIQSNSNGSSGSSITVAFNSNVTSGNLLVVGVSSFPTSGTVSVTDSLGNTYTEAAHSINNLKASIFYTVSGSGGANTVTISTTGASPFLQGSIAEYSGNASSSPLDSTSTNSGTGSGSGSLTLSTGSVPVNNSGELVVGVFQFGATFSGEAAGTGFTDREDYTGILELLFLEDKIGASSATNAQMSLTQTSGGSSPWSAVGASFKQSTLTATYVQSHSNTASGTTSVSAAYSSNVTAGDLLVAAVSVSSSLSSAVVTDTLGNTWFQCIGQTGQVVDAYYCITTSSGANTVTITTSGTSQNWSLAVLEYGNVLGPTGSAIDQARTGTGSGVTANAVNAVSTSSGELGLMIALCPSGGSATPEVGYNLRQSIGTASAVALYVEDNLSVTSTAGATITTTSSTSWNAVGVTFFLTGSSGGAPFRYLDFVGQFDVRTRPFSKPGSSWFDPLPLMRPPPVFHLENMRSIDFFPKPSKAAYVSSSYAHLALAIPYSPPAVPRARRFVNYLQVVPGGLVATGGNDFIHAFDITQQAVFLNGNGATQLDLSTGCNFVLTLLGNTTLSFVNGYKGCVFTVVVIQGAGGPYTLGWFSTTKTASGGTVSITVTASAGAIDQYEFLQVDSVPNYLATPFGKNYA